MLRKYIFKTKSKDQRPIRHCNGIWAIIGAGISDSPYWLMVIWLEEGSDVYEYYPEAYDVKVQLDKDIEIKRGGDHHIVTCYKTLGFVDGIKYFDTEINPTLIAIIESLAYNGISDSTIAKRAGINLNKFKKLKGHPMIAKAISDGKGRYLEELAELL